jgi:ABC-type sugar transport system substrate-binding protein
LTLGFTTPALGDAITQLGQQGKVCAFGFDLGPKEQEQIRSGALTGSLGQQPFLQGFWPVKQLYLQIDRGISAANLDARAQMGDQGDRRPHRQALRELRRTRTSFLSARPRGQEGDRK